MLFQRPKPRSLMAEMLVLVGVRVPRVLREDVTEDGREERKAPSMFIVRGTWFGGLVGGDLGHADGGVGGYVRR